MLVKCVFLQPYYPNSKTSEEEHSEAQVQQSDKWASDSQSSENIREKADCVCGVWLSGHVALQSGSQRSKEGREKSGETWSNRERVSSGQGFTAALQSQTIGQFSHLQPFPAAVSARAIPPFLPSLHPAFTVLSPAMFSVHYKITFNQY